MIPYSSIKMSICRTKLFLLFFFFRNQASRQDSTSSLKSANHFRSKGSSNAKLTEERKNDILEILKNSIGSSKAAEVGNAKFIEELSKRMNAAVKDMRKWLGITDNLEEV